MALPVPDAGLRPRARTRSSIRPGSRRRPTTTRSTGQSATSWPSTRPSARSTSGAPSSSRIRGPSCPCTGSRPRRTRRPCTTSGPGWPTTGSRPPDPCRAGRDLLFRLPPRVGQWLDEPLQRADESGLAAARRLALALDHTTLAIQGPPGSGKTYTGARMVCSLLARASGWGSRQPVTRSSATSCAPSSRPPRTRGSRPIRSRRAPPRRCSTMPGSSAARTRRTSAAAG